MGDEPKESGLCLAMDRTYAEARQKMEGPLFCNKLALHDGDHECVVGGKLLGRWSSNKLPSAEESIARVFPGLSLVAERVADRFIESREAEATTTERAFGTAKGFLTKMVEHGVFTDVVDDAFVYHLALLLKSLMTEANTYRDTCKAAQEAGTRKHDEIVRARNLLRGAQPYLELHENHQTCGGDLFLHALCEEVAQEIGDFEHNATEEEGRDVAKRLGIDIEKWAEELRAKIDSYAGADKRKIVCLCGSTRFGDDYAKANLEETLKGNVVLSVGCTTHSDSELKITDEQKIALDVLHKDKITMADEILVLNVLYCKGCGSKSYPNKELSKQFKKGDWTLTFTSGDHTCDHQPYIGDSTKSEIEYALRLGKTVRFLNAQGPAWIEGIEGVVPRSEEDVVQAMKLLGLA